MFEDAFKGKGFRGKKYKHLDKYVNVEGESILTEAFSGRRLLAGEVWGPDCQTRDFDTASWEV